MKINTVQDLIDVLNLISDKSLPITAYSNFDYERYNDAPITIVKKVENRNMIQVAFVQKDYEKQK
jgi:hypothetical protein